MISPCCTNAGSVKTPRSRHHNVSLTAAKRAFTLVELLITLLILLMLAGIALPVTKNLIKDQRQSRATRALVSFIDTTRNRAIAEQREMGIVIERLDTTDFGRAASIRVRQMRGLPSYTGESAKARARLIHDSSFPPLRPSDPPPQEINAASFDPIDNQLLLLSAQILDPNDGRADATAPIRIGDRLELPGGRMVTIRRIYQEPPKGPLSPIIVNFYLQDPVFVSANSSVAHPQRPRIVTDPPQRVPYAIHRAPLPSNTRIVSLPRGTAIDLNYSGIGIRGRDFAPEWGSADPVVIFDAKGRISRVQDAAGNFGPPTGQLYFCVGELDGIRPDNLLATDQKSPANLLRPESTWIVMNPSSGRVVAAPFASVSSSGLVGATEEARFLARLGDTLE